MTLPPAPLDYINRMPVVAETTILVPAQVDSDGRIHELEPHAAEAWTKMHRSARNSHIELILISAFRSVARQHSIVLRKLEANQSLPEILRVSAYPGHSEHHSGRAVDVGSPHSPDLEKQFESTPEFRWLSDHAPEFGFTLSYPRHNQQKLLYEPWHWYFDR